MLFSLILAAALSLSQAPASSPPGTCAGTLDALVRAHETDYPGYRLEILTAPRRTADYRARLATLSRQARTADRDRCLDLLQAYVAIFDDPHLSVAEAPEFNAAQAAALRVPPETRPSAEVDTMLAARNRRSDPIVGRWFEAGHNYAIVPDRRSGGFIAVENGTIVARFRRDGATYRVTTYAADRTPRHSIGRIHRNAILSAPPLLWGRRDAAAGEVDATDPGAPAFAVLNARASLLTLPTFYPQHRPALDQLLAANAAAIQARELLIVDLRGNVGGTSTVIAALAPYYYAPSTEPHSRSWADAYVLSSPGNIALQEQQVSRSTGEDRDFFADLVARMRAAPGTLIPLATSPEIKAILARQQQRLFAEDVAPAEVFATPRNIAFLVDEHTISAPEAALLSVRRSPRVTIFGRPTAGATDYQNVVMLRLGAGEWRYMYGLPTIVSTNRLPAEGFRATGVPVDVPIDLDRADPIMTILRHYHLAE